LHLHTVKELSHLPGLEFPDNYPRYVPRLELAAYYGAYARNFSIEPLFGEEAKTVRASDGGWLTTTGTGLEISSDNVVIATGLNQAPFAPSYPGAESFAGRIVHSKEYRNAEPFIGEKVLVIGLGNTGAEIALDLSEAGVDTTISVRGPVNIVPRDVLGRPTQLTARMLAHLPLDVGDGLGKFLRRMTVGDLTPYGIATPEIAPLAQLRERGKTPVIDVGTVDAIKKRRISVRPAVHHFEGEKVVFGDGGEDQYDTVIMATGYRPLLHDLLPEATDALDEKGLPRGVAGDGPNRGLFFIGFDNHRPGGVLGTVVEESAEVVETISRR
jgi:cation diffusion facilitator CzcD-associated flavoprotein CzcO